MSRIGLIDVDGHNFPNLALMKLSSWHKAQGDEVEWYNQFGDYDVVYMSKVFTHTLDYSYSITNAKEIIKGGTGYDLHSTLPKDAEKVVPDYSLYPFIDCKTAYGFLTRGCIRKCPWCVVPKKEGMVKPYQDVDEIAVTRRYYRSGESEYKINGETSRLRDIHEMFMDTGLGRDGYSLVSQGRIADLVSAKSTQRRDMLEEASGISHYRYRRADAKNRLKLAEDNLVRLRDILSEVEKQVGPLKTQSEKAKKYLERMAEVTKINLGIVSVGPNRDQTIILANDIF